jgi:hypothetical protein
MKTRKGTKAVCDFCKVQIGDDGGLTVEWDVPEESEDPGQRFLCSRCSLAQNPEEDYAWFWANNLLAEHKDANAKIIPL